MEKETSSLVSLGIVLIAIAVVITLGFGIFAVGKRLANNGQNDLVNQVDQINNSTFTDLDQQVVTGTRLKGIINQLSTGNYAILINTLALRNNQADGTALNGDVVTAIDKYYFTYTNSPSLTSKGTQVGSGDDRTIFVNYNAILKNSAQVSSPDTYKSNKKTKLALTKGSSSADAEDAKKALTLMMADGIFTTELEFFTDTATGQILKCNRVSDFTKQGTTMYIADGAQFNSYCIKDSTDNYVGLAFQQIQK